MLKRRPCGSAGQEIHSTAGLGETSLFLSNPPSRPIYLCIALSRHYVVTHTCDFQSETHQDAVCGRALSDDTAASVPSFFCPFTINTLDVTDYLVWMAEF